MKILLTIILFCIPLSTYATYEELDLIFTLQDMWVFTEFEIFWLLEDILFENIL